MLKLAAEIPDSERGETLEQRGEALAPSLR
jgi:hypothetical protein